MTADYTLHYIMYYMYYTCITPKHVIMTAADYM